MTLALWVPDAEGVAFSANTAGIALRLPDVAAARARLEPADVEFLGNTVYTGVCHMAFFRDPDGNVLILHHRYARQARLLRPREDGELARSRMRLGTHPG